ncbi:MAG: CoA transferase, partial [Desulfobacterales bacterium]|nr:CoA transferase [Desulfobacterales bacterium]
SQYQDIPMTCLTGIRVLDFTQVIAGPVATMLLGDLGAEVIKIEPPEGDAQRHIGETNLGGESVGFFSVNRNKKSVVVDMRQESGRAFVQALAGDVDIVIENFRPGVADRLGIGYEALAVSNPKLIYCSVTGFGRTGPYKDRAGMDQIIQAFSGVMQLTGSQQTGPLRTGFPLVDLMAPLFATIGILGALQARHASGRGQRVDVSMLNAALFSMIPREALFFATGAGLERMGNGHSEIVPCNTYETQDGRQIMLIAHTDKFWRILADTVGDPVLRDDAALNDKTGRIQNRGLIEERLGAAFRSASLSQWSERLTTAGVLFSPVRTLDEVFDDPQVKREMVMQAMHPTEGPYRMLGNPISFSETPVSFRHQPPQLGEHTEEMRKRVASRAKGGA